MFSPLNNGYVWHMSLRYYRESQRNRFFKIAQERYAALRAERLEDALEQAKSMDMLPAEATVDDLLQLEEAHHEVDELQRGACSDVVTYLQDHREEIDEAIIGAGIDDGRDEWWRKSFVKSAVYEYFELGEMSDEQVAALMRVVATLLAWEILDRVPELDEDEWSTEIRILSDYLYLGEIVQRHFLNLVERSDLEKKVEMIARAAGKDEERLTFDGFIAHWCAAWRLGENETDDAFNDALDDARSEAYMFVVNNKETVRDVAFKWMAHPKCRSPWGTFVPDTYFGCAVVSELRQWD